MCHAKGKPAEHGIVATLTWLEQQAPCGCGDVLQPSVVWSHKDGDREVVSPETQVPSHDTGQNVNRFAGPR